MIIYDRGNGYSIIDTNAEAFQLGHKLYEAQVILSKLEPQLPQPSPTAEDVAKLRDVAHWFCCLVAEVGYLRAGYSTLADVVEGRAEYHYTDKNGWCWEVKRLPTNKRKERAGRDE